MNPNALTRFLDKPANDFTKADLIRFIEHHNIQMINFRYCGGDGRLKTLNFVISSREHLNAILSIGERVDGSSLFPFIQAGNSDIYVIPRYKTAFVNPFSEIPSLDLLCSYYEKDGKPLESSPGYILNKAHQVLKEQTGFNFEVMGELEYYVISPQNNLYQAFDQKGYHESMPFAKQEHFRTEAMLAIAQTGGIIKYGHSEVGNFSLNGFDYEQNEIEFLPVNLEDAADQLVIAKWILRSLAYKRGLSITFAPKITTGKAGNGLHIHTRLMKNGKNAMLDNGILSDTAKQAIAGYLDLAPSLTAFGNTIPTSYFRLVPHQEAPTNICWGDRNRSVLVRVPLGWTGTDGMILDANPQEPKEDIDYSIKQTVEFRSPDGSADIYLLLAGLTVAARHGIQMPNALDYVCHTYAASNIPEKETQECQPMYQQLPVSCHDSADRLLEQSGIYTKHNVFPGSVIEGTVKKLKSYQDQTLRESLEGDKKKLLQVVEEYFHCG